MKMSDAVDLRGFTALCVAGALLAAACATGCGPQRVSSSAYAPQPEVERNSTKAEVLTRKAAERMDSADSSANADAESLLREALAADLYHGPAHNNLGVVYMRQGRLYEAANEFEWARKLMPGNPDPRFNLALTLERAGRTGEALAMYGTALEVQEGHLPSMQALARLQVKERKPDGRTDGFLREIAMRGSTATWREWAQGELVRRSTQ